MKFKRAVIKQMLSEEIIIANSQLHDKMSSPILPVPHHTKTLMRHPHVGFAFVSRVNCFTGVSWSSWSQTSKETQVALSFPVTLNFPSPLLLLSSPSDKTQASAHSRPLPAPLQTLPDRKSGENTTERENQTRYHFSQGDSDIVDP